MHFQFRFYQKLKPTVMKTLQITLLALLALLFYNEKLPAQVCEIWSDPVAFTDSLSDNRNPFIAAIPNGQATYYVFWEKNSEENGSEIVCKDYYNMGEVIQVVGGNGNLVSNPKVISMAGWYPFTDTLAYVFYETDQAGNKDIYYKIMTMSGFSDPVPFAVSDLDESHLSVNQGGGLTWQAGDMIKYTRLIYDDNGYYFNEVVVIDDGECFNPELQGVIYYEHEEFIAWEKGAPGSSNIWYSQWGWDSGQWGLPIELFPEGDHSRLSFSKSMSYFGFSSSILVSDVDDGNGQNAISLYDFYEQIEMITSFSQSESYMAELFTVDIMTDGLYQPGYLAFTRELQGDNFDIYSSDFGQISDQQYNYCQVDSTDQPDTHPQLFEGMFGGYYFDLVCFWESWRNGHWQLFSSVNKVIVGMIPESDNSSGLRIKAAPNPFSDILRVECESVQPASVNISLINTNGAVVKEIKNQCIMKGTNTLSIKSAGLPQGIYLLSLESKGVVTSLKVLKR
jgi:hypothetical protein